MPTNLNFMMTLDSKNATKEFEFEDKEWILKHSYKAGKFFKGFEAKAENIKEAFEIIKETQNHSAFFIHGAFIDGVDKKRMIRRKRTDHPDGLHPTLTDRPVQLFCLDVDGYTPEVLLEKGVDPVEEFVQTQLPDPFTSADYIYQFSSSYGLTTNKLNCHLFFWLKEPVHNLDIKAWIKNYNKKKGWGSVLDDSILTCTQPIYIQKRICTGAEDPIKNFIGLVIKDGDLDWNPGEVVEASLKDGNLSFINSRGSSYDLAAGVEKILTSENYHEELNKLALSLINQKVPPKTVQSMLEGAMNAAKVKGKRWQDRFDDIGRSVSSAVDIVGNPTIEEVLNWIQEADKLEVKANFAGKLLHLSPIDRATAITQVVNKIGYGVADIKRTIKIAEKEYSEERAKAAKEAKSIERETNGIYEVEVTATNSWEVVKKAGDILAKTKKTPQVFSIGGSLARVDFGSPKTIRQISKADEMGIDYPKLPIIIPYRKPYYSLSNRITKDIIFQNEKAMDIEPPTKIIHEIGQAENNNFKSLAGIVENPYIDSNWKLIQKQGYNKVTGLYTLLHHKLKIKKMDPVEAYKYLSEVVFDEFPFKSKLDVAVAVSALLTCAMRPTIAGDAGMPGFGIVSPIQSSGKTTLAQLLSYSIYNRPVAASSWSSDEEELGKHILAILQEGHSCVLFDNIKQGATIQSGKLANAMSNDVFGGRQLGENKTIEVPSCVIWLFTGNGIRFVGDFATRVYPININPNMENPNIRVFQREDIGQWAMDNRKHILSAVLSIIIGGKDMEHIGGSTRFKLWDKFVRRPVYKASGLDVNKAVSNNQEDDPIRLVEMNLLHQLKEQFGSELFTTKDITDKAFGAFEAGETDLGSALTDLLDKKASNKMSIGRYLSGLVDVVLGDLSLKKKLSNVVYWRVIECQE